MMAAHTTPKLSFGIYRADGSKVPSLKKSFIIQQRLDWMDLATGSLTLEDGTKWELLVEPKVQALLNRNDNVYCIVSYQVHDIDGEAVNYCIARLYTPKRQTND